MYTKFEIGHFRGIQAASFDGFRRINLITGLNNTGKTAALEALFLHSGSYNPDLASVLNAIRGVTSAAVDLEREHDTPWDSIFYNYRSSQPVRLSGTYGDSAWDVRLTHVTNFAEISGLSLSVKMTYEKAVAFSTKIPAKILKLEYRRAKGQARRFFLIADKDGKRIEPPPPVPPFPCRFQKSMLQVNPKEEVHRFARVQLEGTEEAVLRGLQILEPRLTALAVLVEAGEALIHGNIGLSNRRYIPLAMMGDGVNRLSNVLLLIASAPNGIVLFDEIDIGWHHSALPKVWRAIALMLDVYKVQLFCTTHSQECLFAAHDALRQNEEYPLSVYRLERQEETTRVIRLDKESIQVSVDQHLEIR
jgi:AAA15 family ATPase/GTPase